MPPDAIGPYGLRRRALLKSLAACCAWQQAPRAFAGGLRVGAPAPPATLVTLDGERIVSGDLIGQVVILTFWATWCSPCREELPLLADYLSRHSEARLRILAFSLDTPEELKEVRAVARSLNYPVGLMLDSSAPGYGRMWRLPVSFTIDRRGLLAEDGWKEKHPAWSSERLEQVVTPLLAQPA